MFTDCIKCIKLYRCVFAVFTQKINDAPPSVFNPRKENSVNRSVPDRFTLIICSSRPGDSSMSDSVNFVPEVFTIALNASVLLATISKPFEHSAHLLHQHSVHETSSVQLTLHANHSRKHGTCVPATVLQMPPPPSLRLSFFGSILWNSWIYDFFIFGMQIIKKPLLPCKRGSSGVPDGIRTHDLQSRSLSLYPAGLRVHAWYGLL